MFLSFGFVKRWIDYQAARNSFFPFFFFSFVIVVRPLPSRDPTIDRSFALFLIVTQHFFYRYHFSLVRTRFCRDRAIPERPACCFVAEINIVSAYASFHLITHSPCSRIYLEKFSPGDKVQYLYSICFSSYLFKWRISHAILRSLFFNETFVIVKI